jgi:hypothetical protein
MKYFIFLNSKKVYFKASKVSSLSPTIKKIFNKNSIDIFKYLEENNLPIQKCSICNSAYNPYFTLEFTIFPNNEVKISNVINGHKSYNYEKYNKNYCYGENRSCPGIKMNPNSIEFISLTLNLSESEALEYIHKNNKSPFYLNNHESHEEYSNFQSRSKTAYINKYGEDEGLKKYNSFCDTQKYSCSKHFYLDKFGPIDGENLWKEISKKKAITLSNMTRLYGEEIGLLKLNNWKASCSKTNSQYIQEFGIEEGLKKIELRNSKRISTWLEHGKLIIPADQKIDYLIYHHLVQEETKYQLLLYGHLKFGKDWQNRKKIEKLEVDHCLSIKSGFISKISPSIIGSIENLNLMLGTENNKKGDTNSIEYSELINNIQNSKYGK